MNRTSTPCYFTNASLFRKLSPATLKKIAQSVVVHELDRKKQGREEVRLQGKVYIVHAGRVFLSYIDAEGRKIILDILPPGSVFGDLDFGHASRLDEASLFMEPFSTASVCEVDKEDPAGMRHLRLHERAPWIFAGEEYAVAVRRLGEAADDLARREVLASPGEVERILTGLVVDTPLAAHSGERLAELAAAASRGAARSSRLEIYPRQMQANRALDMSVPLLRSGITPEEVQRRVIMRYPAAEPLPGRPDLDHLMEVYGLKWNEREGIYHRPGDTERTSFQTRCSTLERHMTALPWQPMAMDPAAMLARQFDERLRSAVERRSLRILGVGADRAQDAALALGERLGVAPVVFDQELIKELRVEMKRLRREDVVHEADRDQGGEGWRRLLRMVKVAAERLRQRLLPPEQPLLLVQPGLMARYRLDGFLQALVQTARSPEAEAILLLVPSVDSGGIPRINGELAIPGVLASQSLWVPREWIENRHNAAA